MSQTRQGTSPSRQIFLRTLMVAALAVSVVALALLSAGCSSRRSGERLSVMGSTTVQPIAEISGKMFEKSRPGTVIFASGVGSSEGIVRVSDGTADIGTSSRDLKPEEEKLGLVDTPVAYDAIAVIVNPANPVKGLTKEQVKAIFQGKITNWKEVGGRDLPIGLVNRDEASGTRETFDKIVLDKEPFDPTAAVLPGTGQVRAVVAQTHGAVGYISLGFVNDSVKALAVDGVAPSEATVKDGTYPIRRLLHFFTKGKPKGLAEEYIEYVLSPKIQNEVVAKAGFLPIGEGAK